MMTLIHCKVYFLIENYVYTVGFCKDLVSAEASKATSKGLEGVVFSGVALVSQVGSSLMFLPFVFFFSPLPLAWGYSKRAGRKTSA